MSLFRTTSVEPRISIHIMFQHAYEQGEMEKVWSGGLTVVLHEFGFAGSRDAPRYVVLNLTYENFNKRHEVSRYSSR